VCEAALSPPAAAGTKWRRPRRRAAAPPTQLYAEPRLGVAMPPWAECSRATDSLYLYLLLLHRLRSFPTRAVEVNVRHCRQRLSHLVYPPETEPVEFYTLI
jgi:hypothetical protein